MDGGVGSEVTVVLLLIAFVAVVFPLTAERKAVLVDDDEEVADVEIELEEME